MTGKFIQRTLRNVILPKRPYFAHLALTHRCNLKCRFCHVTETSFAELNTESMCKAIDVLDKMGVAVLSISGGGEPLLRDDFDEIINHAAERGLYVKLTSNGTMPRAKYERLLRSRIDEIGISLDGVMGHDLPFSHVGSPILSTLRYLNDNLPAGKKLTINVTVSQANRDQVQGILDYCAERYPQARVWLNPVAVGEGALRTSAPIRTEPDYLRRCNGGTRLSAGFYTAGAEEQYGAAKFDWGCLAGEQFFDVKPNGDFWLCQDQPSPAPLNVLQPGFAGERKRLDKGVRRDCTGCVYSCYYVVQQSFRPVNWPDVALLWWQSVTAPGSRQRRIGDRFGWVAGLCSFLMPRLAQRVPASFLPVVALALALGLGGVARSETRPAQLPAATVLDRMEEAGRRQQATLESWSSTRVYTAANTGLRKSATVKAQVDFASPARKSYAVVERQGMGFIVDHVIRPILDAECESAADRAQSDINRTNYEFRLLEFEDGENAYVFEALPRAPKKFLFRGRIWVDAGTFGVRRVLGSPASRPSIWVKRTEFTHEYREIGGFWLPVSHRSRAELKIVGTSTLEIDYGEYTLRARSVPVTALTSALR
ncbi:MAG TPA: radical SAM protein [Paludibaculum sp.]|jgi:hypothetical protein